MNSNHVFRSVFLVLFLLISAVLQCASLHAASTITVTARDSNAELSVFAGSGGAVDQGEESNQSTALNGNFSFTSALSAVVTSSMAASNGAATAGGSLTVSDSVTSSSSLLHITATRGSSSSASWSLGTGNGIVTSTSELLVDFTVTGDPVPYTLQTNFDHGLVNGIASFRIGRPFASFDIIDINNNTLVNYSDSGFLPPNDYRFRVRIVDQVSANSGNIFESDASSYSIDFQLNAIPEPGTISLLVLGGVGLLLRARRRR